MQKDILTPSWIDEQKKIFKKENRKEHRKTRLLFFMTGVFIMTLFVIPQTNLIPGASYGSGGGLITIVSVWSGMAIPYRRIIFFF